MSFAFFLRGGLTAQQEGILGHRCRFNPVTLKPISNGKELDDRQPLTYKEFIVVLLQAWSCSSSA